VSQAERRALIEARQVAAGYALPRGGYRPVLRGVSLGVAAGELLALVGTNGSGKTTLLRVLSGALPTAGGDVLYAGEPLSSLSPAERARRIGVLPQHVELPAGFQVSELVAFGRAPHAQRLFGATPDDEAAVVRALADAGLTELADRDADTLSGGERQRVLLAMTLAQEPALLLLDEPTLHLDLAHQVALLATLARLRRSRGLAVIAVLHDLNLAAGFAPRIAVLSDGRLAADGAPDEVLTPELVTRVFGVPVEVAATGSGRRHLALHAPG